jgi:uncharacterized membrane protein HdeD (DUF308 family)
VREALGGVQATFAVRGLVVLAIGLLVILWPEMALSVFVVLLGAFVLVDGLLLTYAAARTSGQQRWLLGLQGLAGVMTAIVAFVYPQRTIQAVVYLFGAWAIITGLIQAIDAVRLTERVPQAGLLGICGVLSVVLGVLLIRSPDASALLIARLFGVYQLAVGAVLLTLSERLRQFR